MNYELIKVCGMRDADNIRELDRLSEEFSIFNFQFSVRMMGFIFWPKSSRCVTERPAYLPTKCKRVGVFVDEEIETVKRIAEEYALDYIQLHGNESPEYCARLRSLAVDDGFVVAIIKAFSIAYAADLAAPKNYEGIADLFLFDAKGPSVGGNGRQFDWSVLSGYTGNIPFLLSGGIGPDDAGRIKTFRHPKCIGIDLNSRFELAPGLKDVEGLRAFLSQLSQ